MANPAAPPTPPPSSLQVSVKGKASSVSLLQMATFSGLCVLVRLQTFRGCRQPFPVGLMEVLRDPRVFKVGVGCYEDGKRLTRDYGLALSCTVDLRYLALRQRYVCFQWWWWGGVRPVPTRPPR